MANNVRSTKASSLPGFIESIAKPFVSTRHGRIWSMPRALRHATAFRKPNFARENTRLTPLYVYPSDVSPLSELPPFFLADSSISESSLLDADHGLVQINSSHQNLALPDHTFEPVVNYPALAAFLLIVFVFSLLQMRIIAINNAASYRIDSLKRLREVKSAQLSSAGLGDKTVSESEVALAVARYEEALESEENLRTIIPGVRIAAPNSPTRNKEDLNAAKQFLGKDLLDADSTPRIDTKPENQNETQGRINPGDGDSFTGLSRGAVAVLGIVALSQIALLFILSFDPMATSHIFSSVGGAPPSNVPLTSW